jgi:hypothetical protein
MLWSAGLKSKVMTLACREMNAVLAWLLCATWELPQNEPRTRPLTSRRFVLGEALDDHQLSHVESLVENPLQHATIGGDADEDLLHLIGLRDVRGATQHSTRWVQHKRAPRGQCE